MCRFEFGSPKGERLIYWGYALEIFKHPIGWRGVSKSLPFDQDYPSSQMVNSQSFIPQR